MGLGEGARGHHLSDTNFEAAFSAYEAVRHRLPAAGPGGTCAMHENLDAIADRFDVFLLDAFGVLNIGEAAIAGVPDRVARLQAAGKRVIVVSNAAGLPHAALMEKYRRLGYAFADDDVISSRKVMIAALDGGRGTHWGLMATRSAGLRDLERLHLTYLEEDPSIYGEVDGFLLVGSAAWTEERQALLTDALIARPRPVLVGNPDIVAPREVGLSIEPGHFAHNLADKTGLAPQFFGKPFANIFEQALKRVDADTPRDRIVMVGDSLHTDILGAQAFGLQAALITGFGFLAGQDAGAAIDKSGIRPDFMLARP